MNEKLEFLASKEWEIKELGDIYGNREDFDEYLYSQNFKKELHNIKITVEIVAK